jgi:uncharacterized YccA/Bax inhibitor family protein
VKHTGEIMTAKNAPLSIKDTVSHIGILLVIMLALSLVQFVAKMLSLFPSMPIEPMGLAKIALMLISGGYLVKKRGYALRSLFVPGFAMFLASCIFTWSFVPAALPVIGKIISVSVVLCMNLAIYMVAIFAGGFFSRWI